MEIQTAGWLPQFSFPTSFACSGALSEFLVEEADPPRLSNQTSTSQEGCSNGQWPAEDVAQQQITHVLWKSM